METITAKATKTSTFKTQQGQAKVVPAGTQITVIDRRRDGKGYTLKTTINGERVSKHNAAAHEYK